MLPLLDDKSRNLQKRNTILIFPGPKSLLRTINDSKYSGVSGCAARKANWRRADGDEAGLRLQLSIPRSSASTTTSQVPRGPRGIEPMQQVAMYGKVFCDSRCSSMPRCCLGNDSRLLIKCNPLQLMAPCRMRANGAGVSEFNNGRGKNVGDFCRVVK